MKDWIISKWEKKPQVTVKINFTCTKCMRESLLEISQMVNPIAQIGAGVVFDPNSEKYTMPDKIICPRCFSIFEYERS